MSTMEVIDDAARPLPLARRVQGASGLAYRAQQLAHVSLLENFESATPWGWQAIVNARIESALVNARALAYFLTSGKHNYAHNLHFSDYTDSLWHNQADDFTPTAEAIIRTASRYLAHASPGDLTDTEVEPHPGQWPLTEIALVITRALSDFIEVLETKHVDRAGWFCPRPTQTYDALIATDPMTRRTPRSEHPEVGELTKILHRDLDRRRPVPAAEAIAHALQHTRRVDDGGWYRQRWTRGIVEVPRLRTAQNDFRGAEIEKQQLFTKVLDANRVAIESGGFPEAERIKTRSDEVPAVMIECDDAGELFVADGQCRVFSALWHGFETVDAYIFHRRGVRERPS